MDSQYASNGYTHTTVKNSKILLFFSVIHCFRFDDKTENNLMKKLLPLLMAIVTFSSCKKNTNNSENGGSTANNPQIAVISNYEGNNANFIGQAVYDSIYKSTDVLLSFNKLPASSGVEFNWGKKTKFTSQSTDANGNISLLRSDFSATNQAKDGDSLFVSIINGKNHLFAGIIYKPFQITTWQDLQAMRVNLSGNYSLMNDITLPEHGTEKFPQKGFAPIGESFFYQFMGSFEGNNHTINNLYINSNLQYVGLFGVATLGQYNTKISNLKITLRNTDSIVTKYGNKTPYGNVLDFAQANSNTFITAAGAVVGLLEGGTIENVNVTGGSIHSMAGSVPGLQQPGITSCGGIAGATHTSANGVQALINKCTSNTPVNSDSYIGGITGIGCGSITYCNTSGNYTATGNAIVGGLIGCLAGDSTVTCSNSFSSVNIVGRSKNMAGGLIGQLIGCTVKNCYAKGNISGSVFFGGSLIGTAGTESSMYFYNKAYCNINSCYATGSISTTFPGSYISALVGFTGIDNTHPFKLKDCYASGNVDAGTSGSAVGIVFVANYPQTSFTVENCFYSGNTLSCSGIRYGVSESGIVAGYDPPGITGSYPLINLKNNYANSALTKNFTGHFDQNIKLLTISTFTTNPGAVTKTTDPFIGFDFANVWAFVSAGWPTLKNMPN
jgi:hypothetical protein